MPEARTLRLTDIPGIGPKLRETLVRALGSEERALKSLIEGRVDEVAKAVESPRRALRLIQAARAAARGYTPGEVAATPEARRIVDTLLGLLASHAASRPARDLILSLTPAPPGKVEAFPPCTSKAAGTAPVGTLRSLQGLLRGLDWPGTFEPRAEVYVAADPSHRGVLSKQAEALGLKLEAVDPGEVDCSSPGPPVLVHPSAGLEARGRCIELRGRLQLSILAPRSLLDYAARFLAPARTVLAAPRGLLEEAAGSLGLAPARLLEAATIVAETVEAYASRRYGGEYERLSRALEQLDSAVSDLEVWLNDEAKKRLESRVLRVTAAELLRMLGAATEEEPRLPPEVVEVFEELSLEAEERLAAQLGLTAEEAAAISGLVNPAPRLPLEVDASRVEELRRLLASRKSIVEYSALAALASRLEPLLNVMPALFQAAVWMDQAIACRLYSEEIRGSMPKLLSSKAPGVAVVNGREVELTQHIGSEKVEPVSYVVGCTPYRPEGTSCERITLLTGANSGGKTTLLRLLAETVLAAQLGIPAPAEEAWVTPFRRVYYLSKPSGTLSAGALETILRQLAGIVSEASKGPVLVLVDEFEAVTEAHAAAGIIAGFVKALLADSNAAAVIVTHMADEILARIGSGEIRVDGIEAAGLDENYNLIVRRSPVYGRKARSTPELVVTKLVHTAQSRREKEFYKALLEALSPAPRRDTCRCRCPQTASS